MTSSCPCLVNALALVTWRLGCLFGEPAYCRAAYCRRSQAWSGWVKVLAVMIEVNIIYIVVSNYPVEDPAKQQNKQCLIDVRRASRKRSNEVASEVLARPDLLLVGQVATVVKFRLRGCIARDDGTRRSIQRSPDSAFEPRQRRRLLERGVHAFRVKQQCKWVRGELLLLHGSPPEGYRSMRRTVGVMPRLQQSAQSQTGCRSFPDTYPLEIARKTSSTSHHCSVFSIMNHELLY